MILKAGQKMITTISSKVYDVVLFPLEICNITQVSNPDSFSHCCGNAIDCVGRNEKADVYAPCKLKLFNISQDPNSNARFWTSVEEVYTPSGLKNITLAFLHDDNPPFSNIGDVVEQGQLIAHTGIKGFVTGDHTHIEQAVGNNKLLVDYGITCSGGNRCYAIDGSVSAETIFFINDTVIVDTKGLNFKMFEKPTPPFTRKEKMKVWQMLRKKGV